MHVCAYACPWVGRSVHARAEQSSRTMAEGSALSPGSAGTEAAPLRAPPPPPPLLYTSPCAFAHVQPASPPPPTPHPQLPFPPCTPTRLERGKRVLYTRGHLLPCCLRGVHQAADLRVPRGSSEVNPSPVKIEARPVKNARACALAAPMKSIRARQDTEQGKPSGCTHCTPHVHDPASPRPPMRTCSMGDSTDCASNCLPAWRRPRTTSMTSSDICGWARARACASNMDRWTRAPALAWASMHVLTCTQTTCTAPPSQCPRSGHCGHHARSGRVAARTQARALHARVQARARGGAQLARTMHRCTIPGDVNTSSSRMWGSRSLMLPPSARGLCACVHARV